MLAEAERTNTPEVNALLSLMCFHASRFEARVSNGEPVLYEDQDESSWNRELIARGIDYFTRAATGDRLTKYHLEAAIAYWHTTARDSTEKWASILHLYNQLLILEYSPIAALNRTYALAKTDSVARAIAEAEELELEGHYLYHSLLGRLYQEVDLDKARDHYREGIRLAASGATKATLRRSLQKLEDEAKEVADK
jgi:RNA polymerase sigma-70 factor (ECF subfamily)